MKRSALLLSVCLAATLFGCKREAPPPAGQAATKVASKTKGKSEPATAGAIARIVFVDQEGWTGDPTQ